ncbi:molybdopterin molybdenumtransferase MoeA, partial [Brevibacillus reuszeri]
MRFSRQMVTVEEAVDRLLKRLTHLGEETVQIEEAYGRILASDVTATYELPHFDRSPLDGFAVRAADTNSASVDQPVYLRVLETVAAGQVPQHEVTAGCA